MSRVAGSYLRSSWGSIQKLSCFVGQKNSIHRAVLPHKVLLIHVMFTMWYGSWFQAWGLVFDRRRTFIGCRCDSSTSGWQISNQLHSQMEVITEFLFVCFVVRKLTAASQSPYSLFPKNPRWTAYERLFFPWVASLDCKESLCTDYLFPGYSELIFLKRQW